MSALSREDMIPYRECRVCKQDKPLDPVHFRVFNAVSHRYATACRACEIELAARRGETLPLRPIEVVIPRQTNDAETVGGTMHNYAGPVVRESEDLRSHGNNQHTETNKYVPMQQRTMLLWLSAIETLAARYGTDSKLYDAGCDELWLAYPRDDHERDEVYHASFAVLVQKVTGQS